MPHKQYNRALSDLNDYVNRRIAEVESDLEGCIDNDGPDKRFFKLCGRRNELAALWLQLQKLERPDLSLPSPQPETD